MVKRSKKMSIFNTPIRISGKEVLPLIEGGKGISVSSGQSSGPWAKEGGVATFSAVNADFKDENGNLSGPSYKGKTRKERHEELIKQAIDGGITQAKIAYELSDGKGRIHMNVLWEMAGVEHVLNGVLEGAKGLVHGVTCGAGMPYKLSEIASKYKVYYYPIVSSARAFNALWKRAYSKASDYLGGVVYEDPWRAGGHNGLSNSEDPEKPEDPYPRVAQIRKVMNGFNLEKIPVIMAGGVWHLKDWKNWFDNVEIGPVGFQFGTRPLLTKESPISDVWKKMLLTLKKGDIVLNKFSPTGFYSSAIKNSFLTELLQRSERQIDYRSEKSTEFSKEVGIGPRKRIHFIRERNFAQFMDWIKQGFTEILKTPDSTLIFVTPEKSQEIKKDQVDCMGCLSQCMFSNWMQKLPFTTGKKADPRSFCIQKTLQDISHTNSFDNQLAFAGHNAYKFATDPFYQDGFIPSVKELIDRILTGE